MYLTFAEYTAMGGQLDESVYTDYEYEAESLINWYTFNRLTNMSEIPEAVKRCMYKLITLLKLKTDSMVLGQQVDTEGTVTTSGAIQSQANDGVSISFNTMNATEMFNLLNLKTPNNEFESTIKIYLNGTVNDLGHRLLYRGLYPDE